MTALTARHKGTIKEVLGLFGATPSTALAYARLAARPWRWPDYLRFRDERRRFRRMAERAGLSLPPCVAFPLLGDRHATTPIKDPYYFYQDTWGASQVARVRPARVVDVGSSHALVAAVAQFVPVTAVDIRPLRARVPHLDCRCGSILELPYEDGTVEFLMSLCVVEHIGLGRYGDPIDPEGTDKACRELRRVIRPGGRLALSVPVGPPCVAFNAHRVFRREDFLAKLPGFAVEDEVYCIPHYSRDDPTPRLRLGEYAVMCVTLRKEG